MRERVRDRVERCAHEFDVCVVGGGMAGMCAAIASARRGARTAIVHDRPVYGGNASSEVRMWICGAHGRNNKETGILEEILLANARRNPGGNYSIWDGVLYEKIHFQPGLTAFLNCSCTGAETERDGDRIHMTAITAWQTTTQVLHTIRASLFIDCSGDSILAADSGARFRVGREARDEFGEDIEPKVGDDKTMGNSLLIQMRKTSEPQPFTPPRWAYTFDGPEDLPHRIRGVQGTNFWWLELGGLQDTIEDAEGIRDELLKVGYGVWDYVKNRAPEREEAVDWGLEWLGSLPGKRESRRYVGDHILTQNDIRAGGPFEDIVAYGGWTMDDHHPAGLLYPQKPTIFHPAPSPYGIPYRCLYSANVENLLFAGRNVSVTHAALSSTRVMATCAVIGQAAGTAAALCVRHGVAPAALCPRRVGELQAALMEDDAWLPGKARAIDDLSRAATLTGGGEGIALLLDGHDRDLGDTTHGWRGPVGGELIFRWERPVTVGGARFVFDSDLTDTKRMPCSFPQRGDRSAMPGSLARAFRVDAWRGDGWETLFREDDNDLRVVYAPIGVETTRLRFVPEATWGADAVSLFGFEALRERRDGAPRPPAGGRFRDVVAATPAADLAPPDGA